MCTPQLVQAYRWIVAEGSTTLSLLSFAVTCSLSRDTTATWENVAPLGFQHLVQPQTWLCADCAPTWTVTRRSVHWQFSVPPANPGAAGLMPRSTAGWMENAVAI